MLKSMASVHLLKIRSYNIYYMFKHHLFDFLKPNLIVSLKSVIEQFHTCMCGRSMRLTFFTLLYPSHLSSLQGWRCGKYSSDV